MLAFMGTLPVIGLIYLYTLSNDFPWADFIQWIISGGIPQAVSNEVNNYTWWFIGGALLIIIAIILAYIIFGFSRILLIQLSLEYSEWQKSFHVLKSLIDFKRIIIYTKVAFFRGLLLSIPILLFIIFLAIFAVMAGGVTEVSFMVRDTSFNYFTITSGIVGGILLLQLAYLYFRTYFSWYYLADNSASQESAIEILKKIFAATTGWKKLWKFIVLWIIFLIIFVPFNYIVNHNDENIEIQNTQLSNISRYETFQAADLDTQNLIRQQNPTQLAILEDSVQWLESEAIVTELKKDYIFYYIYVVLAFLLSYWLVELYFLSYYHKKIKSHI